MLEYVNYMLFKMVLFMGYFYFMARKARHTTLAAM